MIELNRSSKEPDNTVWTCGAGPHQPVNVVLFNLSEIIYSIHVLFLFFHKHKVYKHTEPNFGQKFLNKLSILAYRHPSALKLPY